MAIRFRSHEDSAGTYLDSIPFLSRLIQTRLVTGQPQAETARVWNEILSSVFPTTENFSTGFETVAVPDRINLCTSYMTLDAQFSEVKFLVVMCKTPGQELYANTWETRPLRNALIALGGHGRKWAVMAVGKYVRFYELLDGDLKPMADGQTLFVDRQCATIMDIFINIRASL